MIVSMKNLERLSIAGMEEFLRGSRKLELAAAAEPFSGGGGPACLLRAVPPSAGTTGGSGRNTPRQRPKGTGRIPPYGGEPA